MSETEVMELGRRIERLMEHPDFREAIIESYINSTALAIGSGFYDDEGQRLELMAVSHLKRWLEERIDEAKIIQMERAK